MIYIQILFHLFLKPRLGISCEEQEVIKYLETDTTKDLAVVKKVL